MPHSVGTEAGTTGGFPLLQPVLPGFVTVNALSGDSRHKASTRSPLSVAARARIAAAQRARWAKVRGHGQQKQNVVTVPKKKTMSAAARRKIAAAERARWAKEETAKKKST
jgi:hypothetical protein